MRKIFRLGAFAILCLLLPGCSNLKQVDASGFLELTKEIGQIEKIRGTMFIGVSKSRVYLERWEHSFFSGYELTVYWTPLSGLPKELVTDLRAGKNPWLLGLKKEPPGGG